MDGHTVDPIDPKLGMEDQLYPFETAVEAANVFQPGAKCWHGYLAARCHAERRLGINNFRT